MNSTVNRPEKPRRTVTLGDWQCVDDTSSFGGGHVEGYLRNDSGRTLGYVEVSFAVFDASGYQLGRAMTNTLELEPGVTWKFRALIWQTDASYVYGPTVEAH